MKIRAYDPVFKEVGWPDDDVSSVNDLSEGLAWADCLSMHVPKIDKPVIGEEELQKAKPGIIIANTARGGVIDEQALIRALSNGRVGAAGIDVFEQEPPPVDSPLLSYDNVVLSPHIAGLTEEGAIRLAIYSIENAIGYLEGTIDPALIVNREMING